ncbi:SPOR domain-containing protein [Thiolapillus brandeum]|uniref:SPOR domain-containing protein n=1 Tax=Thiolapillus brandeum TaxID=1076588 RepID=A0A7U6GIP9_9GAMM|nr:SPOR domain-containing protein [Thiolapillus brandeum]BAO44325.1 hypothetical protein TBH_C1402 [Thiolapillus brandeum]
MFRKDTSTQARDSRQAGGATVSRYRDLAQDSDAKQSGQLLELTEDSVDFSSVLNTISESQTMDETPRQPPPGSGNRDLNISSVIERIQDEGPAVLRRDEESRPDQTRSHDITPAEEADKVHETVNAPIPPTPTAAEIRQLAESAAQEILSSRADQENTQSSRGSGWMLMILMLFLLTVGGYILYRSSNELAMARSHISQLSKRLFNAEEALAGMGRQVSGNTHRIRAVLTPQEMHKEMLEYQKQIFQEVDDRLDLTLLSQGGYIPTDPRHPSSEPAPVASPPEESVASSDRKIIDKPESMPESTGDWQVYLASYATESQAKKALTNYSSAVPGAIVQSANVKGREVYRVVVPGLSSKKKAMMYLDEVKKKLGLKGSWIGRHKEN